MQITTTKISGTTIVKEIDWIAANTELPTIDDNEPTDSWKEIWTEMEVVGSWIEERKVVIGTEVVAGISPIYDEITTTTTAVVVVAEIVISGVASLTEEETEETVAEMPTELEEEVVVGMEEETVEEVEGEEENRILEVMEHLRQTRQRPSIQECGTGEILIGTTTFPFTLGTIRWTLYLQNVCTFVHLSQTGRRLEQKTLLMIIVY